MKKNKTEEIKLYELDGKNIFLDKNLVKNNEDIPFFLMTVNRHKNIVVICIN